MQDLLELYQQLYSLSQQQEQRIEEDDYSGLLEVLNQKRELMDRIEKIDVSKYIHQQQHPRQVYRQLKQLMEKTKELEDKNIEEIENKHGQMQKKMEDLSRAQKTRNGYQKASSNYEAKFFDEKK